MKDLEQIIKETREALDSYQPGEKHLIRFRQKLFAYNRYALGLADYLKIAAVVVLASMFSFFLFSQLQTYILQKDKYSLGDVSPEYREVEQYYTRMINYCYAKLDRIDTGDPDQKSMLVKELTEMDRLYISLQKDLKANPADERIIDAMISHYQMKLEIMNQILLQLENINNNINLSDHENKDI